LTCDLSQTLATTAGASYQLSFAFNNLGRSGEVLWDGQDVLDIASGNSGWTLHTLNVTATSNSTELSFLAFGSSSTVGLDAVSVSSARTNRRCWTARPDLGRRWPSRLVATAVEERLRFRRKSAYSSLSSCCLRFHISSLVLCGRPRSIVVKFASAIEVKPSVPSEIIRNKRPPTVAKSGVLPPFRPKSREMCSRSA